MTKDKFSQREISKKVSKLKRLKFLNKGRDINKGVDCYGLCMYLSKELMNKELPELDYKNALVQNFNINDVNSYRSNTNNIKFGDIIVLNVNQERQTYETLFCLGASEEVQQFITINKKHGVLFMTSKDITNNKDFVGVYTP